MVKLFGYTFFEKAGDDPRLRALDADKGPGAFYRYRNVKEVYNPERIEDYYRAYMNNDLIRCYIDDLVEAACGTGMYTTVEVLSPIRQTNRAKTFVDHFNLAFNLDGFLPNVCRNMLIAGFCPVEIRFEDGMPEDNAMKIIHPKTVTKIDADSGEVKSIIQRVGKESRTIQGENLAWFVYCQIANDPRGNSLIRSTLPLLNILEATTKKVDEILDRYISPLGIWKTKRAIDALKAAVMNRVEGEDIFLGHLSDEELMAEALFEFITIDPRVPFWEYIEYMDRRIYSSMRANNTWYSKDATQASMRLIDDIVQRHVRMIQRDLKRATEGQIYQPLVVLNHLPEIPKLNFGAEPTGVEKINIDNFLMIGLQAGYVDREEFREILRRLGVPVPEAKDEDKPKGDAEPVEKPKNITSDFNSPSGSSNAERFLLGQLKCMRCGFTMSDPGIYESQYDNIMCPACRHLGVTKL